MISSKEDAQRRMLGGKAISPKNTKLGSMANIANRSPVNKFENKASITTNTLASKKTLPYNNRNHNDHLNSPRTTSTANSSQIPKEKIDPPFENSNQAQTVKNHQNYSNSIPYRVEQQSQPYSSDRPLQISKKQGSITINLQNGDIYIGEIDQGMYHGQGQYFFKSQNLVYRGGFMKGRQQGQGVLSNATTAEAIYDGMWEGGKKNGLGNYFYGSDEYYNGQWRDDQKEGNGFFSFQGGTYNGQWNRNRAGGRGNLKLADGTEFKGKFENNDFLEGTVKYPNGDEYYGEMKNNRRNSQDSSYINLAAKIRYKGGYFNDKKHGKGSIFYQNGDQISGMFRDGKLSQNEVASYRWRDGTMFQGWFREGKPHKGTMTWPNGQKSQI